MRRSQRGGACRRTGARSRSRPAAWRTYRERSVSRHDIAGIWVAFFDTAGVWAGTARIDFTWTLVEKTPGEYTFAQYDALVSAMAGVGVRPQFSLDYGNSLYNCSSGPGVIGPPATPAATGAPAPPKGEGVDA